MGSFGNMDYDNEIVMKLYKIRRHNIGALV